MLVPTYACTYVVYHLLRTKQCAAKQIKTELAARSLPLNKGARLDYSATDCTETLPNMELQNTHGAWHNMILVHVSTVIIVDARIMIMTPSC